uniref:ATP synthase complex subunit 8 n=1 Tax=Endelus continentalis TaxID=2984121 RepID=A0A977TQ05_9COLE|nr:ATP synthase F0 subunit 8 [Endelus continentalis]UXX50474.1 ATP synthase F0 subunit 8 [Endelus continentalis]
MPQMAPMKWLLLFTLFSWTFLLFMISIYYNNSSNPIIKNKSLISKQINWKW